MAETARLESVQGLMVFLASMANGLEEVLGKGAGAITYRSGRETGLKTGVRAREPDDLLKALDLVRDEMCRLGMRWSFVPYQPAGQKELLDRSDGTTRVQLVFDNCMVRCALFRYGHPQKLSLCLMNHGLFCGLLDRVHGGKSNLEILHAGENACLKVLTVTKQEGR